VVQAEGDCLGVTMVEGRHALHCPACGRVLGEVAADGRATIWRTCPKCGAHARYDLPEGRWTVERPARRR
jgi:phage FluMu protein Com